MFENNPVIAVATSGGPDSMALLDMMRQIVPRAKGRVVALTVDHGLRAESATEAETVAAWCKKNRIAHVTLAWQGAKPQTGVHETARTARYELLENFCRSHHILHLATAHHADDQAETILQRIAKASGPAGLSGIAEHSFTQYLHVWRPLLSMSKSELVDYCTRNKIPFASDPSNDNPKYARGRLRRASDVLAAEGLQPATLALLAKKQRAVTTALEIQAAKFLANHARLLPGKRAEIAAAEFSAESVVIQRVALDYVLKLIGQHSTPIRYDSLNTLCAALSAPPLRARTLAHCRIAPKKIAKKNSILITPELRQT